LETFDEVDIRIEFMKNYIKDIIRDFKVNPNICIVSHTSFLSRYLYKEFRELKHCHIYEDENN